MKKKLNLMVIMDSGAIPPDDTAFEKARQEPTVESHVVTTLRGLGHNVKALGADYDVQPIVQNLAENPIDVVFNLTEQFRNDRRLDKNVAALLELMRIPFTGTGTTGLLLCRDKGLCKEILSLHRVRVPAFLVLEPGRTARVPKNFNYPAIVKPIYEDASDGISNASIVKNEEELRQRVNFVHEHWKQVAIVEEYIEGRELYVGIIGNKRLTVFPPREIRFGDDSSSGPVIATSRVKGDEEYRKKWRIHYRFAKLPEATLADIARTCKRVYRLLRIRDYGRIDLRLTSDNKIIILEANPNPDLAYGEDVAEAAAAIGINYESLIDRIVQSAMRRGAD